MSSKIETEYFQIETLNEIIFNFPEVKAVQENGEIPLRAVLRNLTSMKLASKIQGRLEALLQLIHEYNNNRLDACSDRYIKYQMMQVISGFGFQIPSGSNVVCPGLKELIAAIEDKNKDFVSLHRQSIKEGTVPFDALSELYKPGMLVRGMTSIGVPAGFKVVQSYYQEHKTLFGFEQSFHLELQFVATMGLHMSVVQFEVEMSRWMGEANKKISDLFYAPVEADLFLKFKRSGEKYIELGLGTCKYLHHDAGSVFLHASKGSMSSGAKSFGSLNTPGRIMIDVVKGADLGHHASHGMDDATHALIEITGRYKRFMNEQKSLGLKVINPDFIFLVSQVPIDLVPCCWPALVGFSFSAKSWCHVLVGGLSEIKYNDKAFDQLVLDPKRKQLIRALVRFGGDQFQDIIQGKSGGSIFLLHGPSGVGKTLTAEAVAETLRKPLYYVTMGELGTDPETMEKRLGEILELCAGWDALTLIDEADVFLEKRATSDVLRNAMVCVMLRLLEYHQGILFLTTNRVTEFDAAFESRVTVALKYEQLSEDARQQVWRNLIDRISNIDKKPLDYQVLGKFVLNGRQIKNSIRLAYALALENKKSLDQEIILETIAITNLGRQEMQSAAKW